MVKKVKFEHPRLLPSDRTVSPGKGLASESEAAPRKHSTDGASRVSCKQRTQSVHEQIYR